MRIVPSGRPTRASKRSPLTAIAAARGVLTSLALAVQSAVAGEGHAAKRYYAHEAVEGKHGVIAPWTPAQNGPCDVRVRVAAETIKRYPWTGADQAVMPAPHFVFNGHELWKTTGKEAAKSGHGGGDYLELLEFVAAVREDREPYIDVYDAASWSSVVELSARSIDGGGGRMEIPDFTGGRWEKWSL